jgi:hypothetical protein
LFAFWGHGGRLIVEVLLETCLLQEGVKHLHGSLVAHLRRWHVVARGVRCGLTQLFGEPLREADADLYL